MKTAVKTRRPTRLLRCDNEQCKRRSVSMVHPWDKEAQGWRCNGCGHIRQTPKGAEK